MITTLTFYAEKKHSVIYKNSETNSNAYISKDDIKAPYPKTVIITTTIDETGES